MVVTSRSLPPSGSGATSKCSVTVARSLYGTPFFRRYPARRFDVTTRRLPPPPPPLPPVTRSHVAVDSPCQLRGPEEDGDAAAGAPCEKWKRRVCIPASVSM